MSQMLSNDIFRPKRRENLCGGSRTGTYAAEKEHKLSTVTISSFFHDVTSHVCHVNTSHTAGSKGVSQPCETDPLADRGRPQTHREEMAFWRSIIWGGALPDVYFMFMSCCALVTPLQTYIHVCA